MIYPLPNEGKNKKKQKQLSLMKMLIQEQA